MNPFSMYPLLTQLKAILNLEELTLAKTKDKNIKHKSQKYLCLRDFLFHFILTQSLTFRHGESLNLATYLCFQLISQNLQEFGGAMLGYMHISIEP
jgi:hypothetical protein